MLHTRQTTSLPAFQKCRPASRLWGLQKTAVVCAGVKSILDVPRTLEYLETRGVTVASLKSEEFPAIYSPNSGVRSPLVLDSVKDAAEIIYNNRELGLPSGFLLACPTPSPLDGVDEAIEVALKQVPPGILGKDVTPWILAKVAEITGGDSVKANCDLVDNNARVGGECKFPFCS